MKYEPNEFIARLTEKVETINQYKCPFCSGERFSVTGTIATIPASKDLGKMSLGPNVPAGMIVCEKCGHIDFFALGALGMIDNGKKDTQK